MKKCCLNCAFCVHYKKKTIQNGLQFYNQDTAAILSSEERNLAFTDNFEFIGREIKSQKLWENEYYQKLDNLKKGAYNHIIGGPTVLDLLEKEEHYRGHFPLTSEFRMSPRPSAPDVDYLACWHDLWNSQNKEIELCSLKKKSKCLFFYPYTRKGNKSFKGCEKEREALLDLKHFNITNTLVIAGIIISIIISFW